MGDFLELTRQTTNKKVAMLYDDVRNVEEMEYIPPSMRLQEQGVQVAIQPYSDPFDMPVPGLGRRPGGNRAARRAAPAVARASTQASATESVPSAPVSMACVYTKDGNYYEVIESYLEVMKLIKANREKSKAQKNIGW